MGSDSRALVKETHAELFDYVQSQFGDILSAVQETELALVKRCQGLHEGIAAHCDQRHLDLVGKGDPEFVRSLDVQGAQLVTIVQTRFAELTSELKQCHGGACQVLNRRVSERILEVSQAEG